MGEMIGNCHFKISFHASRAIAQFTHCARGTQLLHINQRARMCHLMVSSTYLPEKLKISRQEYKQFYNSTLNVFFVAPHAEDQSITIVTRTALFEMQTKNPNDNHTKAGSRNRSMTSFPFCRASSKAVEFGRPTLWSKRVKR